MHELPGKVNYYLVVGYFDQYLNNTLQWKSHFDLVKMGLCCFFLMYQNTSWVSNIERRGWGYLPWYYSPSVRAVQF